MYMYNWGERGPLSMCQTSADNKTSLNMKKMELKTNRTVLRNSSRNVAYFFFYITSYDTIIRSVGTLVKNYAV